MNKLITGIHHVTAIAAHTKENFHFYTEILGLRMVKKTVNFEAPEVYHLYYGDYAGKPGSILTFFPYEGLAKGRHGNGMLNTTTFSAPVASLDYWLKRLDNFQVMYKSPQERFPGEVVVYLEDIDGLGLELVFNDKDLRQGIPSSSIPEEYALKGFFNVEIWQAGYEQTTAGILTGILNHTLIAEKGNRFRYAAEDSPGNYIDIIFAAGNQVGRSGSGTVHHLAFATPDSESQLTLLEKVASANLNPSPVRDRKYFSSIYFREPGGVLFEVATAGPGFAFDEPLESLGKSLQLPMQFETRRAELEKLLMPL
jgi:glyoxalase family protein